MNTYTITEKNDTGSARTGYQFKGKSLSAAKTSATKKKLFQKTILTIESQDGILLSVKKDGKWTDLNWDE